MVVQSSFHLHVNSSSSPLFRQRIDKAEENAHKEGRTRADLLLPGRWRRRVRCERARAPPLRIDVNPTSQPKAAHIQARTTGDAQVAELRVGFGMQPPPPPLRPFNRPASVRARVGACAGRSASRACGTSLSLAAPHLRSPCMALTDARTVLTERVRVAPTGTSGARTWRALYGDVGACCGAPTKSNSGRAALFRRA